MKKIILLFVALTNLLAANTPDSLFQQINRDWENHAYKAVIEHCFDMQMIIKADEKYNDYRQFAFFRIGTANALLGNNERSKVFLKQALGVRSAKYLIDVYNSLGATYDALEERDVKSNYKGQNDSALICYKAALELSVKQNNFDLRFIILNNIMSLYTELNQYRRSDSIFDLLVVAPKEIFSKHCATTYSIKGDNYYYQNKFLQAIHYYQLSLQVNSSLDHRRVMYDLIYDTYMRLNSCDSALKYGALLAIAKDSLSKINYEHGMNEMYVQYHSHEQKQEIALQKSEIEKDHIQILITLIGLLVGALIIIIVYFLYRRTLKHKAMIEAQKTIIEHKNTEMTDSINYAKGIQETILPVINDKKVFVLFNPKDIISGDFYWASTRNDSQYYAVADCTGHGVPGALLSMLCSQLLNEAVKVHEEPYQIINYIKKALEQRMQALGRNDGMEIGLVKIKDNNVFFSGIKRPLYVVKNGELKSFSPLENSDVVVNIESGKNFYMSTDGYADQFGGGNDKKFTTKNFKKELELISVQTPENQKTMLSTTHSYWKQENEQTDDVLVFGIKF